MSVDCSGLDAEVVLAKAISMAKPMGLGALNYKPVNFGATDAKKLLEKTKSFDYYNGCPIKLNFSSYPSIDPWGYDRDQGSGAFQKIVTSLKSMVSTQNDNTTASKQESYGGKKLSSRAFKKFDEVYFTDAFCEEIARRHIPYPNEWHMFMGMAGDKYRFMGSMGGEFFVDGECECVK